MSNSVKIANLYRRKTKDGREFFSGPWGSVNITLFINDRAQSDQDPVFNVYISENQQKSSHKTPYKPKANFAPQSSYVPPGPPPDEQQEDEFKGW